MSNATAKIQTLVNKYHDHLNTFGVIIFEWVNVLPYNLILAFISKDSITLAAFWFRHVLKASIQEKLCVGRKHLLPFLQRVKCLGEACLWPLFCTDLPFGFKKVLWGSEHFSEGKRLVRGRTSKKVKEREKKHNSVSFLQGSHS